MPAQFRAVVTMSIEFDLYRISVASKLSSYSVYIILLTSFPKSHKKQRIKKRCALQINASQVR